MPKYVVMQGAEESSKLPVRAYAYAAGCRAEVWGMFLADDEEVDVPEAFYDTNIPADQYIIELKNERYYVFGPYSSP